ncbi:MAG: SLC13 family permease, partial [Gammaproteobacteria bacterium]
MSPVVLTALVLAFVLAMLIRYGRAPDVVIWTGVTILLTAPVRRTDGSLALGLLDPAQAFGGLANEGVVTIAALFVVAAGVRDTGAMQLLVDRLLGAPRSERSAQHRLVWPTALMSAFFNNTPLVAILMPVTDDWARRFRLSVSRLMMPLSFASILGGACTLIGTSTNLIINGWLIENTDHPGLGMFEITPVMLPIAIAGLVFVVYASNALLPLRKPVFEHLDNAREYVVEMVVEPNSELVGKSIDDAGLRGLPGLFLIEIARDGDVLPAVSGNVRLAADDQLVFAGIVDSVVDLQRFGGLRPATDQVFKLDSPRTNRRLIEAVVSNTCPLTGKSVRDGQFRTIYNAAIIAVARNGERVRGKVGDIVLQPGDVLLLETRPSFLEQQRNSRDFYLVSQVDGADPVERRRAPLALAILAGLVAVVASGFLSMLQASMLAAFGMLATRCCRPFSARRAIDWEVLLVIAGALALGKAMQVSGLATLLGGWLLAAVGDSPHAALAAIYVLAAVLAGFVTAKAGAVLMLPVALAASRQLGVDPMPLVLTVMLASSMSVATPIGYPTNLKIYGPGGRSEE